MHKDGYGSMTRPFKEVRLVPWFVILGYIAVLMVLLTTQFNSNVFACSARHMRMDPSFKSPAECVALGEQLPFSRDKIATDLLSIVHYRQNRSEMFAAAITIPLSPLSQELMKDLVDTPTSSSRMLERNELRGKRCLIVDDQVVNLKVLGSHLKRLGMTFEMADDGDKVAQILRMNPTLDYLITDEDMVRVSGYSASMLARIAGYTCPIIVISANASALMKEKYSRLGGSIHVLAKPIDKDQLINALMDSTEHESDFLRDCESSQL